jgi:hypothetical protein
MSLATFNCSFELKPQSPTYNSVKEVFFGMVKKVTNDRINKPTMAQVKRNADVVGHHNNLILFKMVFSPFVESNFS